jgi:crotonobetainyl-CoA:carnitine CoA-transferase CaiB-like acyl-CoA transferase
VLRGRDAAEWLARWRELGLAAGLIANLAELGADEQAWANEYLMRAHCEEVNREVTIRGLPVRLSRTPGSVRSLGPELGQDTELILADTLGYGWDEIAELKAKGAIP